jgi:hypothetical protein
MSIKAQILSASGVAVFRCWKLPVDATGVCRNMPRMKTARCISIGIIG